MKFYVQICASCVLLHFQFTLLVTLHIAAKPAQFNYKRRLTHPPKSEDGLLRPIHITHVNARWRASHDAEIETGLISASFSTQHDALWRTLTSAMWMDLYSSVEIVANLPVHVAPGTCLSVCPDTPWYMHLAFARRLRHFNPFSASCSKLLLFEGFSAILV